MSFRGGNFLRKRSGRNLFYRSRKPFASPELSAMMMANRGMNPLCKLLGGVLVICSIASVGCAHRHRHTARNRLPPAPANRRHEVPALPVGYTEKGLASWYGIPYHGRPAADGEIYNMETLVAAHRTMPFNTWLKVTNLATNQTVNVRIIDRGPFVKGRIIDLSKAAARQIGLLGPGVGEVRLEVISAPLESPSTDLYAVQAGAFANHQNAERLRAEYAARFGSAQLAVKQGAVPLWRVLVGREPSIAAAQQIAATLSAEHRNAFVVRIDSQTESHPSPTVGQ